MRAIWPHLAIAVGCAAPVAPIDHPQIEPRADGPADLAPLLRPRLSDRVPGLAAALVQGGKIVAHGVAGVRAAGETAPIELGDRFHLASCTKSMTAMLAASLVEEGKLTWSSSIGAAFPELASALRSEYRAVTLLELLAHAGQIPAYTQFSDERAEELRLLPGPPRAQRARFIEQVLREEPNRAAGEGAYSNAGYAIAGAMLERAAGSTWEALIEARVLAPLGMRGARFGWPASTDQSEQPRGHWVDGGSVRVQPLAHPFLVPALWPAGAVSASIDDFARYAADQLDGLLGRKALLAPASYRRLHQTIDGSNAGFTLGRGVRSDPDLGLVHFGSGSGGSFFVRIQVAPARDRAVVVASNSGGAAEVTRELARALLLTAAPGESLSPRD